MLNDLAGSWTLVDSTGSLVTAEYCSIAFKPSTGDPYVAFKDVSNSNKTTVMKYNGTTWEVVGSIGFSNTAQWHTLKFNPLTQEPYVAFGEDTGSGYKTTVMRYGACP